MLPLDAAELYDLSEAARLLWVGPERIRRWIRLGRVPATRRETGLHLPRAWVDAACGQEATDEGAVRRYWLERLAPPRRAAGRPLRDRSKLETESLLTTAEAARRVFADEVRLERLAAEGALPALRLDGDTRYDETLVDLLALVGTEDESAEWPPVRRTTTRPSPSPISRASSNHSVGIRSSADGSSSGTVGKTAAKPAMVRSSHSTARIRSHRGRPTSAA